MNIQDKERRVIRDAMDRLLAGTPIRSDGKLTIKSLAAEAGVKRWLLTTATSTSKTSFPRTKSTPTAPPPPPSALSPPKTTD